MEQPNSIGSIRSTVFRMLLLCVVVIVLTVHSTHSSNASELDSLKEGADRIVGASRDTPLTKFFTDASVQNQKLGSRQFDDVSHCSSNSVVVLLPVVQS